MSASHGFPNTWEKQGDDLTPHFMMMMMIEVFKKDINEIQENTYKKVEVLKEETEIAKRNTNKQVKELNKTTKGDNSGEIKPRKQSKSHRCMHN